jgi:hypothetical protein
MCSTQPQPFCITSVTQWSTMTATKWHIVSRSNATSLSN